MKWPVSLACTGLVALAVGACGGSGSGSDPSNASNSSDSASAATLLKETFTGSHKVDSGVVDMTLTVTPHDSSLISGPIVLSLNGPFQSEGADKLPDADITVSLQAEGEKGSAQVISAGGNGYVVLGGTAYSLPASALKQLESSMSSAGGAGAGSSSSAELKQLGINPLHWLSNPTVAGQTELNGEETTHIHADVSPAPMLSDISKLLGKAGQLGMNTGSSKDVPTKIPAATQRQIAHALGKPSFDVWTGTSDQTLRKFAISASIPVTGSASSSLGGMTSADIALTFQYSDLNQPQTIQAPANPQPFKALRTQVDSLLESVIQEIGAGSAAGSGSAILTGTTTGTAAGAALSGADQKYSQCIVAAKGNVSKIQACTKQLRAGG